MGFSPRPICHPFLCLQRSSLITYAPTASALISLRMKLLFYWARSPDRRFPGTRAFPACRIPRLSLLAKLFSGYQRASSLPESFKKSKKLYQGGLGSWLGGYPRLTPRRQRLGSLTLSERFPPGQELGPPVFTKRLFMNDRVLAIDPTPMGFGFALMEGPDLPVDWGVKEASGTEKNAACLKLISDLIRRYEPDVLLLEDCRRKGSRRCERVRSLIEDIASAAFESGIRVRRISRLEVREAFSASGAQTKQEIAKAIAGRVSGLDLRVPPYRQRWMPEDYRMAIFDAVALALAFYSKKKIQRDNYQLIKPSPQYVQST